MGMVQNQSSSDEAGVLGARSLTAERAIRGGNFVTMIISIDVDGDVFDGERQVSDVVDVPRSQVYGAAEDLETRDAGIPPRNPE